MKSILNNEKGFSFLMVFLTMILIAILGLGLISVSANTVTEHFISATHFHINLGKNLK